MKLSEQYRDLTSFVEDHFPGKAGTGERFANCVKKISSRPGFKPRGMASKEDAAKKICASINRAKNG